MFSPTESTIINGLLKQPQARNEMEVDLSRLFGLTLIGVSRTITRLKNVGLLRDSDGILTITKSGIDSVRSFGSEAETSKLIRGRKL